MLVIKLIGASLLVLCGFFFGLKKTQLCAQHANALVLMSEFLAEVRTLIKYKRASAISLLCELSRAEKYAFLKLEPEIVPVPGWPAEREKAMLKFAEAFYGIVPLKELKIFQEAFCSVGEANAETEDEKLEFYCLKLRDYADTALQAEAKNKKLYTGVGLFAGAAIAIILL